MNRTEWKAFHHSIRADARAFKQKAGGFPCFTRYLTHNGQEWCITRSAEMGSRWRTHLRKTLLRERAWQAHAARALSECREYRADCRTSWKDKATAKRAMASAITDARTARINRGWAGLHTTTDKSSRYANRRL